MLHAATRLPRRHKCVRILLYMCPHTDICDMQLLAYLAVLQPDVSWYLISICWIILQLNPGNHQIQSLWVSSGLTV